MGFIPAGAYRNREFAEAGVQVSGNVSLALQDILYDPQTSGGLLTALPKEAVGEYLTELKESIPAAEMIGYVTEREEAWIVLEG